MSKKIKLENFKNRDIFRKKIETWFKNKNIPVNVHTELIVFLFIKYWKVSINKMDDFFQLLPFEFDYKNKEVTCLDDFYDYFNGYLERNFWKELFNVNLPISGQAIGNGELMLMLFTPFKNANKSDLVGKDGETIEVKSKNGRLGLKGRLIKEGKEALNELKIVIEKEIQFKYDSVGTRTLEPLFHFLLEKKKKTLERDFILLIKRIIKILINYTNVDVRTEYINSFLKSLKKEDFDLFKVNCLGLHLDAYIKNERMNYIFYIDETDKKIIILNTKGKKFNDLINWIIKYQFKFSSWNDRSGYAIYR